MTHQKLDDILKRMEPDIESYRRETEAEKLYGPGHAKYCELRRHAGERDVRKEIKPFRRDYLKYHEAQIEYCAGAIRYRQLIRSAELKEAIESVPWEGLKNLECARAANVQAWYPSELRKYGEFTGWSSWPQWVVVGITLAIPPAVVACLLWWSWWFLLISWLVLAGLSELLDDICTPEHAYRLGGGRLQREAAWSTSLGWVSREGGPHTRHLTPPIMDLLHERFLEIKEWGEEQDRLAHERYKRQEDSRYTPGSNYRPGYRAQGVGGDMYSSSDEFNYGHTIHRQEQDTPVYPSVNPASGLPMMDHTPFDVGGHVFGTNDY